MIRAVLFDMDGVLFDSEALGLATMLRLTAAFGHPMEESFYLSTLGVPTLESKQRYMEALGQDFPYDTVMERFHASFLDHNSAQGMPRKPGLMQCLEGLQARGIKIALATSTIRMLVQQYFERMPDIASCFDAIICGGEVPSGKPAPDIYIAAAKAVGCTPEECVGVEDSYNGVRSIRASGAHCVMVPDLLPYDERFVPYVDDCLPSLAELCPLIDRLNAQR